MPQPEATPNFRQPLFTRWSLAFLLLFLALCLGPMGSAEATELVVVGAHYDSAHWTGGANDNGSGVAALLALADRLRPGLKLSRQLRLVAFANEEMPHFYDGTMGSQYYATELVKGPLEVRAMLSLETMGYYDDGPNSQHYPAPLSLLYPDTGNFIALVGDENSADLVRTSLTLFRNSISFPSEGAALPASMPGVGWSDHRSFWEQGVPALMVTDTAIFRYPHYHRPTDTPEQINYDRLARVVEGVAAVIEGLAGDALAPEGHQGGAIGAD